MEKDRWLLSQSKLPKTFQGNALLTAMYVSNRSPYVPLKYEAQEKVWSENNISYGYLRVFHCKAFVHVLKDERSKLDIKARQCIFIDYG